MFGDRFVERIVIESSAAPATLLDALRRDADDWHESRLVQHDLYKPFNGFSMKGNSGHFHIRLRPLDWALQCVGSIEQTSAGSLLRAEIRLTRAAWIAYGSGIAWGLFMIGIASYDDFQRAGWRGALPTMVDFSLIILPFVISLTLMMLVLGWRHAKPAILEFRGLFERVLKAAQSTSSSPDSSHAHL